MKLFAELILIQSVGKRLVEFFLVQFVSLAKEVLNLQIIVLFACLVLKYPQYLYLCHCVKCKYWVFTFFITKRYLTSYRLYILTPSTSWTFLSIFLPGSPDWRNSAVECWVRQLRFGMIWKTVVSFTCLWSGGNAVRCRWVGESFGILGFTSFSYFRFLY